MVKVVSTQPSYSAHHYVYEVLRNGGFFIGGSDNDSLPVWHKQMPKNVMYQDYMSWCEKRDERLFDKAVFCRVVSMLIVSVENVRPYVNGVSQRCYRFPTLRQAQEDFSKASNVEPERIFANYPIDIIPPELLKKYGIQ